MPTGETRRLNLNVLSDQLLVWILIGDDCRYFRSLVCFSVHAFNFCSNYFVVYINQKVLLSFSNLFNFLSHTETFPFVKTLVAKTQRPNVCTCPNVVMTRWRAFRLSEPICLTKLQPHMPVGQGVLKRIMLKTESKIKVPNSFPLNHCNFHLYRAVTSIERSPLLSGYLY